MNAYLLPLVTAASAVRWPRAIASQCCEIIYEQLLIKARRINKSQVDEY